MIEVVLSSEKYGQVLEWCSAHISPKAYYLHTHQGGKGWDIKRNQSGDIVLKVADDRLATFIAIKFT